MQKIMQRKQEPYDYSITFILWDYHEFAGNGPRVITAQQSILYLAFVEYCNAILPPSIYSLRNRFLFWRYSLIGFSLFPIPPLSYPCLS